MRRSFNKQSLGYIRQFPKSFEPPVAGENLRVEDAYLAYVERHSLVKQWMVEDLAEVQVISHQQ
jgi:hypothetical protein